MKIPPIYYTQEGVVSVVVVGDKDFHPYYVFWNKIKDVKVFQAIQKSVHSHKTVILQHKNLLRVLRQAAIDPKLPSIVQGHADIQTCKNPRFLRKLKLGG